MSTANELGNLSPQGKPVRSYEFGPFVLDSAQHVLLKAGKPISLTPKTFDTLLVLVQNCDRMLSKQELMSALWPDSFVEESNLTQQISMIRRALGESPGEDRFIVTVPGRGYRFAAQVKAGPSQTTDPPQPASISPESQQSTPPTSPTLESSSEKIRTQEGNRRLTLVSDRQVIPKASETPEPPARRRIWIAVVALALVALCAAGYLVYKKRPVLPSASSVLPRSLAILPFQNLRPNPDSDFLGFSLADAVITKLDYVSSLTVRPSSAVQKYRDQVIDVPKVATDLNVDTLLTGNFLRDGDDLRITYQLIEGRTDKILGRGTVDLKYDKLLTVQDKVAQQIIRELAVNLSPSEAQSIQPATNVVPEAYEDYLRGLDLYSRHDFPPAIKMLEKSTTTDPNYALAWAYLGAAYTSDAAFEFGGREQYIKAEAAYERALKLQPQQLEAKIFLANLLIDTGKVEDAVPLLRDALTTNPNHAEAHWELGYAYRFAGMLNESVSECERARQLDPLVKSNGSAFNTYLYLGQYDKFLRSLPDLNDSAFVVFYRGFGEFYQHNWEQAAKDFDRAYMLDPTLYAQIGKALSDSIAHRNADGLAILQSLENKIVQRQVGDPEAMYKIAQAYVVLGDNASGLRALKRSIDNGFFPASYIGRDELLSPLHSEAAFNSLLQQATERQEAFRQKFFPGNS